MTKATSPDKDYRLEVLNLKKDLIQKFIDLKELAESDPDSMVNGCQRLLQEVWCELLSLRLSNRCVVATFLR